MRSRWALVVLAYTAGCAHGDALVDPPVDVVIEVNNVDARQRALVEQHVCALDDVSDCRLEVVDPVAEAAAAAAAKGKKGKKKKKAAKPEDEEPPIEPELQKKTALLTFKYAGGLDHLRHQIAQLPHPGLNAMKARADLRYDGFDNTPPTVSAEKPEPGSVLTSQEVEIILAIPDKDTKAVTIDGEAATPLFDGKWIAHLTLVDGSHSLEVKAEDSSGNVTTFVHSFSIDTTPPGIRVAVTKVGEVRFMLKGEVDEDAESFTMDGKAVSTSAFGNDFEVAVTYDPDKTKVTLVAVDAHGNENVLQVPLEDGTILP